MRDFNDRIKIENSQRHEVEKYLGCVGVLTEWSILSLVRKIKELERKIDDLEKTKEFSNIK